MEKDLLDMLVSHTTLAVAATDAVGRYTLYSPALDRMLGTLSATPHDVDEIAETVPFYDEERTHRLDATEMPLARARRGENVVDAIMLATPRCGVQRYLRCNATPLRSPSGDIVGALVLVHDVTTERAAMHREADLRHRLIETVNHELRTPLSTVLGHAELLDDLREELPADARRSVAAVLQGSHRLAELVTTVSELVDLEAAASLSKSYGDVVGPVGEVVEQHRDRATRRGIVLRAEGPERLAATVDLRQLRRALTALVDNALTFAPDDTVVTLCLLGDAHRLQLSVLDQGEGIPAEDRVRLLQPFEVGDHPRQPVNSRGLGLALAHTIATAHGGSVTLSETPPHGFRACLDLPRYGAHGAGVPLPR